MIKNSISDWTQEIQLAKKLATSLACLILAIALPPPSYSLTSGIVSWRNLAIWAAIVVAIFYSESRVSKRGQRAGLTALMAGGVLLAIYLALFPFMTCELPLGRIAIGFVLRPEAVAFADHPGRICRDTIEAFATSPLRVWKPWSVYLNAIILALVYGVMIVLFAVGMLTLVTFNSTRRKSKSNRER